MDPELGSIVTEKSDKELHPNNIRFIYKPSEDVVSREIEGEVIIVPVVSGIGDLEEDLFSLNETGRFIWKHLDGINTLHDITEQLENEYNATPEEILEDVLGLIQELEKRKMIVRVHDNS